MQEKGRDKMARSALNKPAPPAPTTPGLRSVHFVGRIGGHTITPGDVVRLDPTIRQGVVKIGNTLYVGPQTFHRIQYGLKGFVEI
jgi:hypothetical protein